MTVLGSPAKGALKQCGLVPNHLPGIYSSVCHAVEIWYLLSEYTNGCIKSFLQNAMGSQVSGAVIPALRLWRQKFKVTLTSILSSV